MTYYALIALAFTKTIPGGIAAFRFRNASLGLKAFYFLLWFGIIHESISLFSAYLFGHNLALRHYYTAIEFALYTLLYHEYLLSSNSRRIIYVGLLFVPFAIVYGYFFQDPFRFNTVARAIESLILVTYSSLLIGDIKYQTGIKYWYKSSLFIINQGVMFYFATNFLTFIFSNWLLDHDNQTLVVAYTMHAFINAFVNLVFAYALWKNKYL